MFSFAPFRRWCFENRKERKDVMYDTKMSYVTVNEIFNDTFPFSTKTIATLLMTYNLELDQVLKWEFDNNGNGQ